MKFLISLFYGILYRLVRRNNKYRSILEGLGSHFPFIYDPSAEGCGETGDTRYCYGIWLKHLSFAWENGLAGYPETVAELGPGATAGSGLAAIAAGAERCYSLDIIKYAEEGENPALFDDLAGRFKRRENTPDIIEFPKHILTQSHLEQALREERVASVRASLASGDRKYLAYCAPWQHSSVPGGSLDFLFSHATMEHVDEPGQVYRIIYTWLKPGGLMSHQIDYDCHGLARARNGHWRYRAKTWKIIKGKKRALINRLPHSEHIMLIRKAGFRIVFEKILSRKGGIRHGDLAPEFRHIPESDLAAGGAIIQAVKD